MEGCYSKEMAELTFIEMEWLKTTNWSFPNARHDLWLTKSLFFTGVGHFTVGMWLEIRV
jgi:hypothetical protein